MRSRRLLDRRLLDVCSLQLLCSLQQLQPLCTLQQLQPLRRMQLVPWWMPDWRLFDRSLCHGGMCNRCLRSASDRNETNTG